MQFGDSANVSFHPESTFPKHLLSVNCSIGGPDIIRGGAGDVDYLIGGTDKDEIHGGDGCV